MTADTRLDDLPRPPLVLWPTAMRVAFEEGAPRLVGRSKAGLYRRPAWRITRIWPRIHGRQR